MNYPLLPLGKDPYYRDEAGVNTGRPVVGWPDTEQIHLTYHRDDVGVSFTLTVDPETNGYWHVEVHYGGYNEPLGDIFFMQTNTLPFPELVETFRQVCDEWVNVNQKDE